MDLHETYLYWKSREVEVKDGVPRFETEEPEVQGSDECSK